MIHAAANPKTREKKMSTLLSGVIIMRQDLLFSRDRSRTFPLKKYKLIFQVIFYFGLKGIAESEKRISANQCVGQELAKK
jgi:hypothetical protein